MNQFYQISFSLGLSFALALGKLRLSFPLVKVKLYSRLAKPKAWVFLAAHLCWATGFMFLISWRGYWQELIDIILYMHLKTPILGLVVRYRLIFLEIGVDFYISATDFLEIEIYYNKRKFFSLFSLKKELSMGGLLHFRYRLPRD